VRTTTDPTIQDLLRRLDSAEREIKALKAEQELTTEAMRRAEASQAASQSPAYDPSGVYL
jgi:hypothetical protein